MFVLRECADADILPNIFYFILHIMYTPTIVWFDQILHVTP